jgi:hypothetical protein
MRTCGGAWGVLLGVALAGCGTADPLENQPRGPCGWTEVETRAQLDALIDLQCTELHALSVTCCSNNGTGSCDQSRL